MTAPSPLSETVSKVPFIVNPAAASSPELIHFLKFRFYEKGFIVVREEYRLVNPELSEKLCVTLDYIPPYLEEAMQKEKSGATAHSIPPTSTDLIGTCYVFIVAHQNCHAQLTQLVSELYQSDEFLQLYSAASRSYTESQKGDRNGSAAGGSEVPLFINRTPAGAQQAVTLLFPNMISDNIPNTVQSREYVQATLKNALLPALTELAKQKPAEPLEWLAQYLLERRYNAPNTA